MHSLKQNHAISVNIKRTKKPQPTVARFLRTETKSFQQEEPPQKITKLAIGVPGGIQTENEQHYDYHTTPYCFSCDKSIASSDSVYSKSN
jgi:hypothetical protein